MARDDMKSETESSDLNDAPVDITSTRLLRKRILPSSLPISKSYQTEVNGTVDDKSLVGVTQGSLVSLETVTPKVSNAMNPERLAASETTEIYDREAILYELASPEQLGVLEKIERLRLSGAKTPSEIPKKLSLISKDEDHEARRTAEEERKLMTEMLRETVQSVPDSLLHMMTGRVRSGNFKRPFDQKPEWLDMDKYRRGQKFARDNTFAILFAQMLPFFAIFSFEDSLKPLILSGKTSTPFPAFVRYLSTGLRIRNWYTQNSWVKGTDAWKDFLSVRAKHSAVRQRLEAATNEEIDTRATISNPWCPTMEMLRKDFYETCAAPAIGQCPYMADQTSTDRPKGISQAEMALTQWGYVSFITCYPEHVGLHNVTDEELEDFCHLWRSIGYQLGIEDEYNFCRGTLADIRQRSHKFVDTWVKPQLREITPAFEHMLRCFITGMNVILPGMSYETTLLHLTEILDLKMPRLSASLSYKDWIGFNFTKFLLHYLIKIPGVSGFLNGVVNRALERAKNYTPEELEAIRIKFSDHPGNNTA